MDVSAPKRRFTVAEYLERERKAIERHEYRDGDIVQIGGGPPTHSLIAANLIGELGNRLDGTPFKVYESNLRIRIPRTNLYTYADVVVLGRECELDPNDPAGETITNPCLIVEVLTVSSEIYDRTEKFRHYLKLESLREYVLITQVAPRVDIYFRQPDGTWLFDPITGLQASARFRSLQIELPLTEIYAGVDFPKAENPVI